MEKKDLDEIKVRLSIVDVISGYVSLTKSGKNYRGLCPFHHEKTPSFMVSPELQIYKCFGCGRGGDLFSFVQEAEGIDFVAAVKELAQKAGVKIDIKESKEGKSRRDTILEINHVATEFYHYLLTSHKLGVKALKYLTQNRKLTAKTIASFKLGYSPNSWRSLSNYLTGKKFRIEDIVASGLAIPNDGGNGFYDRFRGRVVFPFVDTSGNFVGFSGRGLEDESPKYINTPETEAFHKGKVLFGLDKAKMEVKRNQLGILVEGHMDVISAHQSGFLNVVGTGGTSLTSDQLKLLKKFTPDVALCFDTDLAGLEAAIRGIEVAENLGMNLKVVVIPKPYKDLDECVRADASMFGKAVEGAFSIYDFYFTTAFARNNPYDSIGKKKIVDSLIPIIAAIKNPILKEHYVKKLSTDLSTSEDSVLASLKIFSSGNTKASEEIGEGINVSLLGGISLQEYIITLILKSPLDVAKTTLYKLGQRDFTDKDLETVFIELKNYIVGRKKKFETVYFLAKLSEELAQKVSVIYLKDIGNLTEDDDKLREEIFLVLGRIKSETIKRELKNLGNKIKEAETLGDTAEVKRLSEEFKEISERLI